MPTKFIAALAAACLAVATFGALTLGAPMAAAAEGQRAEATFASGCFWCTESDFDKVPGVLETISGYMGGTTKSPTYKQVSTGETGHAEVVKVIYDPSKVTYPQLLEKYWHTTDIFDLEGQFCDRGSQYRPEIYVHTPEQREQALASRAALNASGRFKQEIKVPVTDATAFTEAEDYHQNFYKTNPFHYARYRKGCGRDARLEEIWGKPKS